MRRSANSPEATLLAIRRPHLHANKGTLEVPPQPFTYEPDALVRLVHVTEMACILHMPSLKGT